MTLSAPKLRREDELRPVDDDWDEYIDDIFTDEEAANLRKADERRRLLGCLRRDR